MRAQRGLPGLHSQLTAARAGAARFLSDATARHRAVDARGRGAYDGDAVRTRLTLDDLAAIACAPPVATPAELARQLGKPRDLVGKILRILRRAGGWYSVLRLPPCTVCDQIVVGPPRRITHVACVPARQARWVRDKRAQVAAAESPEGLAQRRARELASAIRHYRSLPPDRRAAWLARAKATLHRDYAITREVADAHRQRWTEDDDRYVLDNPSAPARNVALALGRTSRAVYKRRGTLRGRRACAQDSAGGPSLTPT